MLILEGETAVEAARREIKEKTNRVPLALYTANKFEQIFDPHKNNIYIAPVFVGFVHKDSKVKINHEHSEYNWFSMQEALEKATIPGAYEILAFVQKHFVHREPLQDLLV